MKTLKKNIIIIALVIPMFLIAQVGINTTSPDASSILDIESSNKGILIPRVSLVNVYTTMLDGTNTAATGLLIYNTNAAVVSGNGVGYYMFNGTIWEQFITSSFSAQKIDELFDGKSDNDGTNNGSSIFLGYGAGAFDDSSDNSNVSLGYQSLGTNTSGSFNTANGSLSLYYNWFANNNSAYGFRSLYLNIGGNNNTSIGADSGYNSAGNNNVFVGYSSGYNETGNNKLYIESSNADSNNALIYGEFDNNILRINGQLQLGTTSANRYYMPISKGALNQVMKTDGSGIVTWVDSSIIGTDDQTLTYNSGTGQLDIEDGNSVTLAIGDITNITAGTGLTGGGTTGAVTLNVVTTNGLTTNANDIVLGGTLNQATTINQGTNNLTFNLNSTGDFKIQDNGTSHFEIRDTGLTYFGDDTYWNDGSTTGTTLARLYDGGNGNDGVFEIFKDALVQHQFNSAGTSVINELGQDFDFRIEGDNNANLFFVDAGNDRIGIMDATPSFDLHLKQSTNTQGGAGGIGFENSANTNNWKIYHSGSFLSFSENGTRRAYITNGTGAYIATSDRRLKKSILEVESILSKVNALKIYRYLYKDQNNSAKKTIGFMAQDVQPLFPELVEKAEDGYLGLNYAGFGVVAIKAIQEQQDIIDSMQTKIDTQEEKIKTLETLLNNHIQKMEALLNSKN